VGASNLGGWIARSIGPRLGVSRVANGNLQKAMPELDDSQRAGIVRGVWDNLGRTASELVHVAGLKRTESGPGWEMDAASEANARALAAQGGPVIFVSAHLANWELLPVAAASFGIRLASFYRAASNPAVDEIITGLRRRTGGGDLPQFAKGSAGARGALAYLRDGGMLGMLVDQKMNDGIEARFFGRPAMTAPAAAAFGLRYQCPVVPAYVQRLGAARFRVVVEAPLALPQTGSRQGDIADLTQRINDRLEAWVRERPQDWLWLHRRWPKQ
jgi:KDO2-lipid IV(A) lauroyltransferase